MSRRRASLALASVFFLSSHAAAQAPEPSPEPFATFEKKDDQGRVISVVTFKSDGTLTHRAHSYGLESEKVTVEEDLDQKRETRRRFRQETDRRGRTTLSEEMRVENGRPVTRRTRSTYDSQGRANSQTEIVE